MPLSEGREVDGKKEGYWVKYYANGNKRSEGEYRDGIRDGKWVYYHKNGNIEREGMFRKGLNEGLYSAYHENGNLRLQGEYGPHRGKSTDGKKEGVWRLYAKDGETVWRIITYKRGARTKLDGFPLGTCSMCSNPVQALNTHLCPACEA